MKDDSESYAHNQIAVFCASLSLIIAGSFYLFRFGLYEKYTYSLFGFAGVSMVVFILPCVLRRIGIQKEGYRVVFLNDTILPLYLLIVLCVIGYLIDLESRIICTIMMVVGVILYLSEVLLFMKKTRFYKTVISVLMTFIFGVFLSSIYWTLLADPLFLENMSQGKTHLDPLFHSAIAQMIRTYGQPSTGIDLIPFVRYHFGSHYLIGRLSDFLRVSVIEFYHFGYLIIFLPLLVRSLLSFVVLFQTKYLGMSEFKLNFLFWFLLFAPFIGFISFDGNSIALDSGIGYQTIIYSESYSISFIYTFIVFSSAISLWAFLGQKPVAQNVSLTGIVLFLPLLIVVGGFIKISTLFLLMCCFCYLFLRLRLFKKWYFIISLFVLVFGSLVVFHLTNDSNDEEGAFYLFQFVNEIIKSPWYIFLVIYYLLTIIFVVVIIISEKVYNWSDFKVAVRNHKLLPLEVLLVISITGFVPGAVMRFYGGNSHYFSEFQYWIAASLILCYLYYFTKQIQPIFNQRFRILVIPLVLAGLYVGYKMDRNWTMYLRRALNRNLNDRMAIAKTIPQGYPARLEMIKAFRTGNIDRLDSLFTVLGPNVEKELLNSPKYHFLKKLKGLDELSNAEKRKQLIHIKNFRTSDLMECYKFPFLFPAFTGIALYKGVPDTSCVGASGYGYDAYRKRNSDSVAERGNSIGPLLDIKSFVVIDLADYTIDVVSKENFRY